MDTPKNISTLYRKMNTAVNAQLTSFCLSNAKAMFLFCIYDHGQMSQVEICRCLGIDKSAVAKMLVRLEKDGMITKTINPDDVRSVLVTLTEKASVLIPQVKEIQNKWLEQVTSELTDLEKHVFCELLEKVANASNEIC